jgi:hypothetical protein
MALAGKLFDKKHKSGSAASGGGTDEAKIQGRSSIPPLLFCIVRLTMDSGIAMHTAAATIIRLLQSYNSSGKMDLQPGDMQALIGAASSLI